MRSHLFLPENEAAPLDEPAPLPVKPINLTWLFVLLVVTGVGLVGWKVLGPSDGWLDDLDAGIDAAEASGKSMFVLYTADWCPPCRELKRTVLSDPGVEAFLEREYVRVKIDLTDRRGPNAGMATEYGVSGIPTMILYDRRGVEIERVTGGGAVATWLWRNSAY